MKEIVKSNTVRFIFFAYLIFWGLLGFTGLLVFINVPMLFQSIAKNVCAWAPTISFLLLFKTMNLRERTGYNLSQFFSSHVNPLILFGILVLQILVFCLAISGQLVIAKDVFGSLSFLSPREALIVFFITLTGGPMGEELGWRAFLLNELQKRYTLIKSAIIVGVIWGLWHLPLWFTWGYSGIGLIQYIISFLVSIISLSVIMASFYSHNKNLIIPIWIHFWFNYLFAIIKNDKLTVFCLASIGYAIFAIIIVLIDHARMFDKNYITKKTVKSV